MAFGDLFKKKYTANVWCNNCNTHSEVSVPKGVTVAQFVESGGCPNCGCNTLVADYKQIEEFRESQPKPQIKLIRARVNDRDVQPQKRAPVPSPRPSTKPKGYKPLPKNQEPDFSLKGPSPDFRPRKIFRQEPADFWTGKQQPPSEIDEGDENYENY